ncbi:hypothetical protein K3888_15560 [Dietzia aurantiaca]|uniref:hypothetical protein n=1 Tax=Dietzia aurantiaca TaxID=983873 RepID=UPI001E355B30|nr:hypothetical protein [Dietzia aurantiaca]MCD2264113.1 hypothetical protein [Dietzia aurantiaca]
MTPPRKPDANPRGRGRFSPSARAHLAGIVVQGDRRRGRATPQWIRELAEFHTKTR